MDNTDFLVFESNPARADSVTAALQFLGFHPRPVDAHPLAAGGCRGIYIGDVADEAVLEQQLALLGGDAQAAVLVADDAALASRLLSPAAPFAGRVAAIRFPLRYEQFADAVRQACKPLQGGRGAEQRFVGESRAMARVNSLIRQVAPFDSSVLVLGESGTGKEMVARTIHDCSPRKDKPFIAINCGAIPAELLESELFGHEKGAFTGAISARKGRFELAEGGTLFLDEIGDMSLPMQVKLLRVLQERQVRPLGAAQAIDVDVRIVSATHRDLDAAVAAGQFREDLYYRLNVVALHLPPLRQRREDIALLAQHALQALAPRLHRRVTGFTADALDLLQQQDWPGNVRQLMNVVEQCCALSTTSRIPASSVARALRVKPSTLPPLAQAREQFERDYLAQLLKLCQGNVAQAARLAGRNRTEFYRLLGKHHLDPAQFKSTAADTPPSG